MHNGTGGRSAQSVTTGALTVSPCEPPREPGPGLLGPGAPRPLAHFLAQLIACGASLEAYRIRRRLAPALASGRYGDGAALDEEPARPRLDLAL